MGSLTPTFSLYKPDPGEDGWASQVNGNFDTIDNNLGGTDITVEEDGTSLTTALTLLNFQAGLTATNPTGEEINLNTDESEIDHDSLQNFVSNEHIDHSGVSITAGTLLTGGGDITTSRTLNVDESSISHDGIDQSTVSEDDHHVRGGFTRTDVTSQSVTGSAWDSAWIDTSAAGGAVTYTLPADGDTSDGDRVEVGIEDATNDTTVSANTGQSILGSNPTLTQIGDTVTMEYKSSTSTWMVR